MVIDNGNNDDIMDKTIVSDDCIQTKLTLLTISY